MSGSSSVKMTSNTREEMEARYNKIGRSLNDLISNHAFHDAKGKELKVFKYGDKLFPPFGDLAISKLPDMEIRDDDIAIIGYPKTGCHWTFEMLKMIIQGCVNTEGMGKLVGFLEMCAPEVVAAQPSPRILNTHMTYGQLPSQMHSKKTKLIVTMRNPKDVLVSYFNHHSNLFNMYGYDGEFSDYIQMYLHGKVDYGSYLDYIADWDKAVKSHPDHPILVLSYEDMKEDLKREVKRIAKFMGVTLEEDFIDAIAKAGQFDTMTGSGKITQHIARKGQVGDWKNWLTVAQNETMDTVLQEQLSAITVYKPRYTLD